MRGVTVHFEAKLTDASVAATIIEKIGDRAYYLADRRCWVIRTKDGQYEVDDTLRAKSLIMEALSSFNDVARLSFKDDGTAASRKIIRRINTLGNFSAMQKVETAVKRSVTINSTALGDKLIS